MAELGDAQHAARVWLWPQEHPSLKPLTVSSFGFQRAGLQRPKDG